MPKLRAWLNEKLAREPALEYLLILLVFDFLLRMFIAASNNIHGDGAVQFYLAKQIVERGRILSYFPHKVVDVVNGQIIHFPVAYPQLHFLVLAFLHLISGEIGIRFTYAAFGTISVLIIYLIVREAIDVKAGVLAALAVSCEAMLYLYSVNYYMEILLLVFTLPAFLFYLRFLRDGRGKNLLLTSLFLGICMAIKQQGILVFLSVLGVHLYRLIRGARRQPPAKWARLKEVLQITLLSGLIAGPFIAFQFLTTGTLFYPPVPTFTKDLFPPKWPEDPVAISYVDSVTTPGIGTLSWYARWLPWFFTDHPDFLMPIGIIPFILGARWIYVKKKHELGQLFFSVIFVNLFFFTFVTPLYRYFTLARLVSDMVAGIGIYSVIITMPTLTHLSFGRLKIALDPRRKRRIYVGFLLLFLIGPVFIRYGVIAAWLYHVDNRTTGGYWPDRVPRIREAADWLRAHSSASDIILIGREDEAMPYLGRYVFWITACGGRYVPHIFNSTTAADALYYIQKYNVTYLWVDQLQFRSGYIDRVPRHGLMDFIELSPFFVKVYQNEFVRIYKVEKWFNNSTNLPNRNYYANVFGDYDDVYWPSVITLYPTENWEMESKYRVALTSRGCYVRVQIPTELKSAVTKKTATLITANLAFIFFYDDSFQGTVKVMSCTRNYVMEIGEINGTASNGLNYQIIRSTRLFANISGIHLRFSIPEDVTFRLKGMAVFSNDLTSQEAEELYAMILSLKSPIIQ